MRGTGATALIVATAIAAPALAHHSIAAVYDRAKSVEVQGVLAKIEVQNPHSAFEISVQDAPGKFSTWVLESRGVDGMNRVGFDAHAVSVGDKVTVRGAPGRQGEHKLWLTSLQVMGGKLFQIDNRRFGP